MSRLTGSSKPVAKCGCCGSEYDAAGWAELPLANAERPTVKYEYGGGQYEVFELRNCTACTSERKSTISVVLESVGVVW
jgi:hypothetical protein